MKGWVEVEGTEEVAREATEGLEVVLAAMEGWGAMVALMEVLVAMEGEEVEEGGEEEVVGGGDGADGVMEVVMIVVISDGLSGGTIRRTILPISPMNITPKARVMLTASIHTNNAVTGAKVPMYAVIFSKHASRSAINRSASSIQTLFGLYYK